MRLALGGSNQTEHAMTEQPILAQTATLASLATQRAGASRVFARHHLDFCCHGNVSLAEACAKRGLDPKEVIREIAAQERGPDAPSAWESRSLNSLITHLLDRYHRDHRAELPRLVTMARRVEQVHAEKAECPRGLAAAMGRLFEELDLHMQKEEQILFPLIVSGRGAAAGGPIHVMEREHEDVAADLERIRGLTRDYVPPEGACGTWRALYLGLAEFERELMEHVHLENHILFPRALRSEDSVQ